MNRQPGTMEPPRHLDAGTSPRLDKLAPSGHQPPRLSVAEDAGSRGAPRCCLAALSVYDYPPGCVGCLLEPPCGSLALFRAPPRLDEQHPPCRLVVLAGSSPRLDKLAASGYRGDGCRSLTGTSRGD